jgi:hypothetical protein
MTLSVIVDEKYTFFSLATEYRATSSDLKLPNRIISASYYVRRDQVGLLQYFSWFLERKCYFCHHYCQYNLLRRWVPNLTRTISGRLLTSLLVTESGKCIQTCMRLNTLYKVTAMRCLTCSANHTSKFAGNLGLPGKTGAELSVLKELPENATLSH